MPFTPKVDYRLRPAKAVERKMIAEALRRLLPLGRLSGYRYVGFGSLYFRDFAVMHRALGMEQMTSVEFAEHEPHRPRFEFNRPFRTVDVQFASPTEVVRTLPQEVPWILWLDYESSMNEQCLDDIAAFTMEAPENSVLLVTANVHLDPKDKVPLEKVTRDVGEERIPTGIAEKDIQREWGFAALTWRLVTDEIQRVLIDRNGARALIGRLVFRQLFNFRYRDTTRMVTVGGLLHRESQAHIVAGCDFDGLDFVRAGEVAYEIKIPRLTLKEVQFLDQQLPDADIEALEARAATIGLSREDAVNYAEAYRYFPSFSEIDL